MDDYFGSVMRRLAIAKFLGTEKGQTELKDIRNAFHKSMTAAMEMGLTMNEALAMLNYAMQNDGEISAKHAKPAILHKLKKDGLSDEDAELAFEVYKAFREGSSIKELKDLTDKLNTNVNLSEYVANLVRDNSDE